MAIDAIVAVLGDIGVTGAAATIGAGVIEGAALGAGVGALTGGNVGKDALLGAAGGGLVSSIGALAGGTGAGAAAGAGDANISMAAGYPAVADASGGISAAGGGIAAAGAGGIGGLLGGGAGGLTGAGSAVSIGGGLYGLYNAAQMQKLAQAAFTQSNPFGPYRQQYAQQLSTLMANPSSITSYPGYAFNFNQGNQAVQRSMASQGFLGSGNEATALVQYGQGYATNFLTQEEQMLAGLAGSGVAPNYGAALSGYASGAGEASSALNSIGYGLGNQQGGANAAIIAQLLARGGSGVGGYSG